MIPREILQAVEAIEIRSRSLVNDVFAGEYGSVFKGRGMEFAEVREYLHGDDIRSIDWNVTARTGQPHVKKFVEEREQTVMFLVDASRSLDFGSVARMKGEVAAEMAAVLAFSAIRNNDKVGAIIFTDRIELFIPPKKGKKHVLRVIREMLFFQPEGRGTDVGGALEYLSRVIPRKAVVFLLSDFASPDYSRPLRVANRRHDLIAITITDPAENDIPPVGLVHVRDAETGDERVVDLSEARVREAVRRRRRRDHDDRTALFRKYGVDAVEVTTDRPYAEPLRAFFRRRERELSR
ncbi:MAG: DUF58 domain-containing protein [Gemmatimonadota bacterium]|jgi:uncharacterized protein (DUF58 family)|nr:DUF58 domain-containing protein [Gemmatimonadota bacterium]MDP6460757.1 DUF58 domain-containing protein [Gemmatimonadota bacterium]MDP6530206.1 DUF58 domain-containing protein [Gemmatimonadota bacterium]MDP6801602.1 DUF58 domain-containing protein [Gemmatimonadota bacterium]MDP7030851.1 DUF58 domain-containing protein [Gemmatimonadota bacterium]